MTESSEAALEPTNRHGYRVTYRSEPFRGPVFRVRSDEIVTPAGERTRRDYLVHVGAVGVVALDEQEQVVLVRQYRHPLRRPLWELPAGLADVAGEPLPEVAARELAEEADLLAARFDLLVDVHPTPGVSDELIRIFLARDLTSAPHPFERRHEEADLVVSRIPLDEAVRMVFAGEVTNGAAVAGVLATARARDQRWAPLRPAHAPLPDDLLRRSQSCAS